METRKTRNKVPIKTECIVLSSSESEVENISSDSDVSLKKHKTKKRRISSDVEFVISDSDSESSPPKRKKATDVKQVTEKIKTNTLDTKVKAKKTNTNARRKTANTNTTNFGWRENELLAEKEDINLRVASDVIKLFEAGNTIPFIARYRRHLTDNVSPEKLRHVKESYEEILALKSKISTALKTIEKTGKLTTELKYSISSCRSQVEVEHLYAPFKQGGKSTLAQRAKKLGLEEPALALLTGSKYIEPAHFVKSDGPDGIKNLSEVEKSFVHMVAHIIATDTDVIKFIRELRNKLRLLLESKVSTTVTKKDSKEDASKFKNYFDYKIPVNYIKPHQVLAITRGENLKLLSVKIVIPEQAFVNVKYFCENKWLRNSNTYATRVRVFQESLKDCYKRLISPLITRQTRAELKSSAEKASIEVFAVNLKKLLLGTPIKGKPIMGIDPGFNVGCKVAVISPLGEVLDTGVIYPHSSKRADEKNCALVKTLLQKNNCSLIALGNGTACRETEQWLTDLIKCNFFSPLDVTYTIVDECGASIYSCSDEAKKEFPKLDALLISAVSLARRVQDPLAELVKIEPHHLGVGMYQHDINKKKLETTLDEIVTECVSFVGVDLNTASHTLLRRVAGLTNQRANSIIKHRSSQGSFTNRYQLKDLKGIGDKVFEQCAGFLRVGPTDVKRIEEFYERPETNPLDSTWIHPESYNLAEKLLSKLNFRYKDIRQSDFITKFKLTINKCSKKDLATEFNVVEDTLTLLINILSKPLSNDLRDENRQEPLFKKGITSFYDIKSGMVLTGRVNNVTHFGAFVDIGVGKDGLIHISEMNGYSVQLGDRVQLKVINVDKDRQRIGLSMVKKM